MKTLGLQFLSSLCGKNVEELIKLGHVETYAIGLEEKDAIDKVREHVVAYGSLPSSEAMKTIVGSDFPVVQESPEYYLDHMKKRWIDRELRNGVEEMGKHLKPGGSKDPEKALELMSSVVRELSVGLQEDNVHDFEDAFDLVYPAYVAQATGQAMGIRLGWPHLDDMSGGS